MTSYSILEIAARNGFRVETAGGGVYALMRKLENGEYCIISGGGEIPEDSGTFETCEVGFYSGSGVQLFSFFAPTVLDALLRVNLISHPSRERSQ